MTDPYCRRDIEIIRCANVNPFYGHSSIIRRYSGYPRTRPIPYIVQHGTIGLSQDFYEIREWYKREIVSHYWAWNHRALEQAQICNSKFIVEAYGAPFLYFLRLIKQAQEYRLLGTSGPSLRRIKDILPRLVSVLEDTENRSDSLSPVVFAPHSLPTRILSLDEHQKLAKYLQLSENLASGLVCMHPYDVYLGNHTAYQEAGYNVVCCMDNAIDCYPWAEDNFWTEYHKIGIEFLINLYAILKASSACFFCGLSTPLFYAGHLRIRCKLLEFNEEDGSDTMPQIKAIAQKRPVTQADSSISERINSLLHSDQWSKNDYSEFKSYSDVVLGRDYLISRKEMRTRLENASHLIRQI